MDRKKTAMQHVDRRKTAVQNRPHDRFRTVALTNEQQAVRRPSERARRPSVEQVRRPSERAGERRLQTLDEPPAIRGQPRGLDNAAAEEQKQQRPADDGKRFLAQLQAWAAMTAARDVQDIVEEYIRLRRLPKPLPSDHFLQYVFLSYFFAC